MSALFLLHGENNKTLFNHSYFLKPFQPEVTRSCTTVFLDTAQAEQDRINLNTKPIPDKIKACGITPQRILCKNAVKFSHKAFPWALWPKLTKVY